MRKSRKLSALRTEEYFLERASRADRVRTMEILARAGKGNPPLPGDELPVGREQGIWAQRAPEVSWPSSPQRLHDP